MEEFPLLVGTDRAGGEWLRRVWCDLHSPLHPIRRTDWCNHFFYLSESSTKQCNITGWDMCKWNHRCTCKACRFQPNPHELQTTSPFSKMVLVHLSTHQIKHGRQSYQRKRPRVGMHERGEQAYAEPELNLDADCTKFNIIAPNQAPVVWAEHTSPCNRNPRRRLIKFNCPACPRGDEERLHWPTRRQGRKKSETLASL